jgi:hypothetical protein
MEEQVNHKNKGQRTLLLIVFAFFIVSFVISPSLFYGNWPYVIMVFFLLLSYFVKDKRKWGVILLILLLSSMALMQALFYFILPLYNNYQPTPGLPLMKIFNMDNKFQVSYYPDLPKGGDNMLLYLDICTMDSSNCTKCDFCNLSGSFINEKGEEKVIFKNISLNSTEHISFPYPGRKVKITLNFEGIDKRYNSFYIPKLNFLEAILLFSEEHPIFRWISVISLFAFIGGFLLSIIKLYKKFKARLKGFICERCSHKWVPRDKKRPVVCPKCKSPYWDKKRKS